jgi:hypothetical protein
MKSDKANPMTKRQMKKFAELGIPLGEYTIHQAAKLINAALVKRGLGGKRSG